METGEGSLESSGGTGVLTTKTRGSKAAGSLGPSSRHRWAAVEVDLGLQVNVILGSVYLEHSVGLEGNAALLEEIAIAVKKARKPWVIGGDLNMDPSWLHQWARKLGGDVISTGEATMGTEEFDYFLAADVLVPLVKEVRVITELACSPHRPVALRLKGVGRRAQVQVFSEPARIPLDLPPPVRPPPPEGED